MRKNGSLCFYGPTKIGKTSTVFEVFRKGYCLLYEPGGLDVVESNFGYTPRHHVMSDMAKPDEEFESYIDALVPKIKGGEVSGVIVDTYTEYLDRVIEAYTSKPGSDGRQEYQRLYTTAKRQIRKILLIGGWFVAICHEKKPNAQKGYRGGPDLPGSLVEKAPRLFSLVLRADVESSMGLSGPRRVIRCDPINEMWVMGDRYNSAATVQPMNLKPIMYRAMHPENREAVPQQLFEMAEIKTPNGEGEREC